MEIITEIIKLLTDPLPQCRSNDHQFTGDIIVIQITNQEATGKLKISFINQSITLGLVVIKTTGYYWIDS